MRATGQPESAVDPQKLRSGQQTRQLYTGPLMCLTALLVAVAVFAFGPPPAFADGGLTVETSATYTINPSAGVVDAVQTTTFTNTVPNRRSGNYIEKTYYEGSNVIIPRSAINVTAQTDGVSLAVERSDVAEFAAFQLLKIKFKSNVFYQGSTTVEIRYSIDGAAPRAEDDISRVNPAFAGFWAIAAGDPDLTKLTVVVPESFEVDPISDLFGTDFETINGNRAYVYSGASQASADGDTGWQQAWVAVSDPANLESSPVVVGDATFDVRGWNDDPEWTAFVTQAVADGVPKLEELFGVAWPGEGETEVRESITPYFYGYGGWYNAEDGIEIGEDLDKVLVLHEIAHGWVNQDGMDERWMIEGMAEYAGRTAAGDTEPLPEPSFNGPLVEWEQPILSDTDDEELEEQGYDTAHYVTATIFNEIGADRFDEVFAAVTTNGGDEAELADWQSYLDAAEPIVGPDATDSTFVSDLFTARVTDQAGTDLIAARTTSRTNFGALIAAADDWPTPTVIEDSLAGWEFSDADQVVARATTTLEARDALDQAAETAGLTVGTDQFTDQFAGATSDADFTVIDGDLAELDTTIDEVVEARSTVEASDGFLASVGALWRDDPEDHLDAATEALADGDAATASTEAAEADQLASSERRTGTIRLAIAVTVLLLVIVLLVAVLIWRRRRRRAAESATEVGHGPTAGPDDPPPPNQPAPPASDPFAAAPSIQTTPPPPTPAASAPTAAAPIPAPRTPPAPAPTTTPTTTPTSPTPPVPTASAPTASAPATSTPAAEATAQRTPPPPHAVRIPSSVGPDTPTDASNNPPEPPAATVPAVGPTDATLGPDPAVTSTSPPADVSTNPAASGEEIDTSVADPAEVVGAGDLAGSSSVEQPVVDRNDDDQPSANASVEAVDSDDRPNVPDVTDAADTTDNQADHTASAAPGDDAGLARDAESADDQTVVDSEPADDRDAADNSVAAATNDPEDPDAVLVGTSVETVPVVAVAVDAVPVDAVSIDAASVDVVAFEPVDEASGDRPDNAADSSNDVEAVTATDASNDTGTATEPEAEVETEADTQAEDEGDGSVASSESVEFVIDETVDTESTAP